MIIMMIVLIFGMMALIGLISGGFISKYYEITKTNRIMEVYETIGDILREYEKDGDESKMRDNISRTVNPVGVSVFIMDSGWNTVYSTKNISDYEEARVRDNVFNQGDKNAQVLEKTDNYIVQKAYDKRMQDEYLEMLGNITNDNTILLRMPIKSIKESVHIFNKFTLYVGACVTVCSVVLVFIFASIMTRPIKELESVANRMSQMDFSARYEGDDKGELGLLGETMNKMSESLERNISQLKSANLELQKDIENKIKIEEMRRDFLSNVSHELKTPIALIEGYAEGLKEGIAENPEDMEYYCDVISDEARHMNNMVKKLLTLDQMEWGDDRVVERFNLTGLIKSILETNDIRFKQNDIKVVFENTKDIYVWSDEYKVEEVVTNYLSNAINHCDFDKIIKIDIKEKNENVRVEVFNTGLPIPEEDLPHLWEKFYKVDKARTREYGGNGIGLSIVKAIMESFGNAYGVVNHSNGVEFWFELDCKNL